ncbi:MAG: peptidase S8 [Bacteroidetes bacterium HGW-Bacteroidetes-2]|jgi:hypothetical protein|nr:MAG: peptidase S8 [Bacteroidetes bacterium HGW-Bacteroidetes-2]
MKIITLLTTTILLFISTLSAIAQTPEQIQKILSKYDLENLSQLEAQAAAEFNRNRQEALDLAAIYGWAESYETENGGQGLLVGVLDGNYPLYYETTNKGAGITARVDRVHTGGTAGLDLNGENMLVGVWDGGLVRTTHELLENRVTPIDGATTFSDHSTHVSGTIIGSEAFQSGNAKGMAPLAEIVSSDFNNDSSEALNAIATYGLLVSNHSYGIPADQSPVWYLGKYDSNARLWDQITFSAPYYLPVFSAGNARNTNHPNQADGGYDILTAYSNSKNVLVVAATFQVLNYVNSTSVNMSSFSSWGPTDDGRIKPDISAKGVNTLSSVGPGNSNYANFSGTSMSAPSVAGAAILLQQHYSNLNAGEFMLSSTLRGLIIHTADEAGNAPGPDYRFGWGLMNTERAAEVLTNNGTTSTVQELTLPQANVFTLTGTAIPGERLVASITWTDKQGNVTAGQIEDDDTPMLVNDLDLRVTDSNNVEFLPWILDHTNFSAPATNGDNFRDNVEKIEIDNPDGDYTITISHKGVLLNNQQVVSLILTGIENVVLSTPDNELVVASIYPNPASDKLNIKAKSQISGVEILNILGQPLGSYKVNTNSTQLDIAPLSAGTYFVRVTIDNASKVFKFIKK